MSTQSDNQMRYFPIFLLSTMALLTALFLGPAGLYELRERRILREGQPAVAQILSMEETGNVYNHVPEVRIEVAVTPSEGAPFRSQVLETLSPLDLQTIRVGSTLDVRFDPEDTRQVAIVDARR